MISFREYLTENNKNTQQQIIEAFGNNIKHDTFYNRAAFENGRINLLLIMGHSGSGKTTLSDLAEGNPNVEVFHCDDLWGLDSFKSEQIKEYGNLINSFWNKETKKNPKLYNIGKIDYDRILFLLLRHAIKYAESHRNKVFILEGIQTAVPFMKWGGENSIKYELPRDCINKVAIIIKHTGALKSAIRAGIRNSKHKFMSDELEKNPFKRAADAFRFWTSKDTRSMYRTTKYDIKKLKEKMKLNEEILSYERPYTYNEVVKKYGKKLADKLLLDPAHKFRMTTGIELIHKEPSLDELKRIWRNWNLMPDDMKKKSDEVSKKLFGMNNKEHYIKLLRGYK